MINCYISGCILSLQHCGQISLLVYILSHINPIIDSFTASLHSPSGRHLPAIGLSKGTVSGHCKLVEIPIGSRDPAMHCGTGPSWSNSNRRQATIWTNDDLCCRRTRLQWVKRVYILHVYFVLKWMTHELPTCTIFMMTSSNGNIFRVTGPFVWGIHRSPVNSPR